VGAQVLLLLQDLQRELGLTYILISHSLPVVAQMATHIAVMRAGQFVEFGPAKLVLEHPEGGLHQRAAGGGAGDTACRSGVIFSRRALRSTLRSNS
jgi:ABC-type glutathione transport system ATPase component